MLDHRRYPVTVGRILQIATFLASSRRSGLVRPGGLTGERQDDAASLRAGMQKVDFEERWMHKVTMTSQRPV